MEQEFSISLFNMRFEFSAISLLIVMLIVVFALLTAIGIWLVIDRKRENHGYTFSDEQFDDFADDDIEWVSLDFDLPFAEPDEADEDIISKSSDEVVQEGKEQPVISIQNVSMKFKVSTGNASGLKEFLIQKAQRKASYRELLALDDVSFDIYKGEVVGIIGTNGSGKSTLLRIVSGALNPTKGKVIVDRSKVQLLTLGTGFDLELTARENVYLNGAIIGYTKEFLDTHFDEIISFAELQDFVDEKVKNFSSGMVSRLGFAIATVGDAAEILILDEVLSVGDEFFKKKSLKRVKEMIHGGSTVLMVSHGMETILENCSKVAWIEKGVLRMVGDAKTVCAKYREMGGM